MQARLAKTLSLLRHLFSLYNMDINNNTFNKRLLRRKKRVGHAWICPRMVTG